MATIRQIQAARRNGAKSQGPVTPEGRSRSSQNSLKHGLRANKVIVLQNESDEFWQKILDAHIIDLKPTGETEMGLVIEIATLRWRLQRACAIETAIIDHEMDRMLPEVARTIANLDSPTRTALAFESLSTRDSFDLTLRYQAHLRRSYSRALRDLALRQNCQTNRQEAA